MISAREELRFVVDRQHECHGAIPRLTIAVVPPSGVSSISSSPSIARTKPRATARPSPTPLPPAVTESLERLEHLLARRRGDTGTVIDDPEVDAIVHATRGDARGLVVRRPAHRVLDEVRHDPLEQRGVGAHRIQRLRHVVDHAVRALAQARDRGGYHLFEVHRPEHRLQHAGLQAAHVEQVRHERGEAIGFVFDRLEELGCDPASDHSMSVWRRLDADALIEASGVRRS